MEAAAQWTAEWQWHPGDKRKWGPTVQLLAIAIAMPGNDGQWRAMHETADRMTAQDCCFVHTFRDRREVCQRQWRLLC